MHDRSDPIKELFTCFEKKKWKLYIYFTPDGGLTRNNQVWVTPAALILASLKQGLWWPTQYPGLFSILALPLIVYCAWVFSLIWGQHDLSYTPVLRSLWGLVHVKSPDSGWQHCCYLFQPMFSLLHHPSFLHSQLYCLTWVSLLFLNQTL